MPKQRVTIIDMITSGEDTLPKEGQSNVLNVIITNPKQSSRDMSIYEQKDFPTIEFVKSLARELGLGNDFRNYEVLLANGDWEEYHFSNGRMQCSFSFRDTEAPEPEEDELEDIVAERVFSRFENPHKVIRNYGNIFPRQETLLYKTDIHPYNTLFVVDLKFKDAALSALDYLGIEKRLHYDPWQLSLF